MEGAASTSKLRLTSSKPHQIFPWNESRDTELHDLEALAQNGLHLVNASIIHRCNCGMKSRTPQRAMTDQAKRRSLFTMNDFGQLSTKQIAPIAQGTALHHKLNVTRSGNVADQSKPMSSPMTHDIFGGKVATAATSQVGEKKEERQSKQQQPNSPF